MLADSLLAASSAARICLQTFSHSKVSFLLSATGDDRVGDGVGDGFTGVELVTLSS